MKNVLVKLKDQDLGDALASFSFEGNESDFVDKMELAMHVLYLDYEYCEFEELHNLMPQLTEELYDMCMDILDEGNNSVTAEIFCEFVEKAFGWEAHIVEYNYVVDVYHGCWY